MGAKGSRFYRELTDTLVHLISSRMHVYPKYASTVEKKRLESDNLFATKANQLGLSIISSCASLTHVLLVHLACLFLIISFSVSDISGTDHGLHDCMSCSKSSAATVGTVIKLLDSFRPVIRISPTTADTDRRRGNVWNTRNWNSLSWLFFFLPPELYTAEHRLSD